MSPAMPIFLLFNALGSLFGAGGGSYISRLLGLNEIEKIKKVSAFSYYGSIAAGVVMLAILMVFMDPILKISGATENTYELARQYLIIVAAGGFAMVIQTSFAQVVRAEGATKEAMTGIILGSVVNIILDPVMILAMNMGVEGAAWATVIGNVSAMVYYTVWCANKKSILSVSLSHLKWDRETVKEVFSIGVPQALMNILMSVSTVMLNFFASRCPEGDEIIAGFGVANRINTVVVMLLIGLGQGIQPLVGYSFSSGNYQRVNSVIRWSVIFGVSLGTVLMLCFLYFPETIVRAFIDNEAVVGYGVGLLKALACVAPIFGIQFIFLNIFQAMGKVFPSSVISVSRQGVFFIATLLIGFRLAGVTGLMWAQPAADAGCVILSSILYFTTVGKELKE